MEHTQLQAVLQKLDSEAVKQFTDFLASPFFNKKKTLLEFWEQVKLFAPGYAIGMTEKKNFFTQLSGKKYNDAYYRNMCSDLLSEVLHFLAVKNFEANELMMQEATVDALQKHELHELTEKQLKQVKKNLETLQGRHAEKLKHRIWYFDIKSSLQIKKARSKQEEISQFMYENNYHRVVMDYTLVKSFRLIFNQMRGAKITGKKFDISEVEKYIAIYESGLHTDDLYVKCYYLLAKIRLADDENSYPELKKIILKKDNGFSDPDLENLMIGTLSYIGVKVESGAEQWRNELFEMYDFRLKRKLWRLYGSLAYTSLGNIVLNALQLGKIKYAEDAVKNYAQYVDAGIRKDITQLCTAWVEFYKGNVQLAHEYLLRIETENILIKYELRMLQCMIFFVQEEYLALLSYLDSFKHFISYNQNLVEESYIKIKFTGYLIQLTKLRLDPNKKSTEKLRQEISTDNFVFKEWLLQQL